MIPVRRGVRLAARFRLPTARILICSPANDRGSFSWNRLLPLSIPLLKPLAVVEDRRRRIEAIQVNFNLKMFAVFVEQLTSAL
jgi:hypothetical protein